MHLEDFDHTTITTDVNAYLKFFINNNISSEYMSIFNVMIDRVGIRDYEAIITCNVNENIVAVDTTFWEFVSDYCYYFAISFFIAVCGFIALYYRGVVSKKEALLKSYDIDPMTSLITLNKFRAVAEEEFRKKLKPGKYELISFDVDMFKTINTHFSQERDTTILITIADALKKHLRERMQSSAKE